MATLTQNEIQDVKQYLKANRSVHVVYQGEKRRLFYNSDRDKFGLIDKGRRTHGTMFNDFLNIEKVLYPKAVVPEDYNAKIVNKYKKMAAKATFDNGWLKKIKKADPKLSLYENEITTGCGIDGQCISLKCIERHCGEWDMQRFWHAVKNKEEFHSSTFDFNGYDGRLWVCPDKDGTDFNAGFSKEYRGTVNGYYYLLINEEYMIGYDID